MDLDLISATSHHHYLNPSDKTLVIASESAGFDQRSLPPQLEHTQLNASPSKIRAIWADASLPSVELPAAQPASPLPQSLTPEVKAPLSRSIEASVVEPESPTDSSLQPSSDFLLAAPENFNPGQRLVPAPPVTPPAPPQTPPPPKPAPTAAPAPTPGTTSATAQDLALIQIENLQVDFRDDLDKFNRHNQFVEPILQFRLTQDQKNLFRIKTGYNTFTLPETPAVTNVPLQFGWQRKFGQITFQAAGGVDLFDNLPIAPNVNFKADIPFLRKFTVSGIVEYGPYKFNAKTLNKQLKAVRLGPNLYWQINRNTSFFSLLRWGAYNDGNTELQSFSRLERRIYGPLSIAANLFSWNYDREVQNSSGYFSPPDFLVYNGELALQGNLAKPLRCRIAANLGRQRLNGEWTSGNTYQASCTARLGKNIAFDVGYSFSNVRNADTGDSAYNNRTFTGQLRIEFPSRR